MDVATSSTPAGRGWPRRRSRGYDALYIHIKGPDVPAHDGRAEDKRDVIAAIDAGFFCEVLRAIDLSSDDRGRHGRPLDIVRAQGPYGRSRPAAGERRRACSPDGSTAFGERACADGRPRPPSRGGDLAPPHRVDGLLTPLRCTLRFPAVNIPRWIAEQGGCS